MLRQQLQTDLIQSMKSGDKARVEVLRYILAQVKNKEVDKKSELDDNEVLDVLRKQIKQLKESIDAFTKGNRPDLVAEYQAQYDIVATYLPKELSDEELKTEIEKVIAANKEIYDKNPKQIIGLCMKELKNKAESSRIMAMLSSME
jgi:uncharacterized protein